RSPGGERFVPLGAGEPEQTSPDEVVYADEGHVLTRRWNYRDCDHAKVTEQTTDVALFVEAPVAAIPTAAVEQVVGQIADGLRTFCGGQVRTLLAEVRVATEWDLP